MSKSERIILLVLAAAMFTHIMDFMIMMPLSPILISVFDITASQFSLLVSSYTITAGITGFFSAFLIDRMDRKKMMLYLYAGFTVGTIACAFSPTYSFLLIARSLTGAFGGVLGALILAMVSDVVPLERRAQGIGIVMASFSAASVFGVPFGLFIAGQYSWHAPFLFLGIICFIILILIFFTIPSIAGHLKDHAERATPLEILKRIFGRKNPRLGLTFTAMLMMGHFTIIPLFAAYMVGNVGFTETSITYIYAVGGSLTFFTAPWVGRMADRHGRLKLFTIFGFLTLIPVVIITNMGPTPIWVALIVTAFFFIFANGRMVPATTMETAIIRPENRGSYMSIRSAVQQLTAGLAAYVAGLMVYEEPSVLDPSVKALVNYDYVGYVAVFFSLIALLLARRLKVEQGA